MQSSHPATPLLGVSQSSFSTERPPLEFAPRSLHSRATENERKIDRVTLEFHLRIQHHGFLSICLIGLGVCGTSLILQFPRVRRVPLTLSQETTSKMPGVLCRSFGS